MSTALQVVMAKSVRSLLHAAVDGGEPRRQLVQARQQQLQVAEGRLQLLALTDVNLESDLENECPLAGVNKVATLPIEQAVEQACACLQLDSTDMAVYVSQAKKKAARCLKKNAADKLTGDEIAAINLYTHETDLYKQLNAMLRKRQASKSHICLANSLRFSGEFRDNPVPKRGGEVQSASACHVLVTARVALAGGQQAPDASAGNGTPGAPAGECRVVDYEVDANASCVCAGAGACDQWVGELGRAVGQQPVPGSRAVLRHHRRRLAAHPPAGAGRFVLRAGGARRVGPPECGPVACTQRWWARAATDRCDSGGDAVELGYEFAAQHRLYQNLTSQAQLRFIFPAQDWCELELGLAPPTSSLLVVGNDSTEEAARLDAAGLAGAAASTQLYFQSDGSLAWPCFLALVGDQRYAPLQGLVLLRYTLALGANSTALASATVDYPPANWTGPHSVLVCPEAWPAAPPGSTDVTVVVRLDATFGLTGPRRRLQAGDAVGASVYSTWRGRVVRPASAPGLSASTVCLCAVGACRQCHCCFRCYKTFVLGLPWASPTAEEALLLEEVWPPCARCRELGQCRCELKVWADDPWYERREFLPTLAGSQ
eukprot:g37278.t1